MYRFAGALVFAIMSTGTTRLTVTVVGGEDGDDREGSRVDRGDAVDGVVRG